LRVAYSIVARPNVNFDVNISFSPNGWIRTLDADFAERYYWAQISPGISLSTKNRQDFGVVSDLSFSVPVWQAMFLPLGDTKFRFDINGKVGWRFEFGLAKYLTSDKTLKVSYFHEYYGFKQSPMIFIGDYYMYEPSSSTSNNGVKLSFEIGFGGK
jgi:hypothetical protein